MKRLLLLALLLAPAQAFAQVAGPNNPRAPVVTAEPAAVRAAQQGLQTYVKLVKESNFRKLGFQSLAEVRFAKLGVPFDDVFIPLDRLKAHAPGGDLKALFQKGVRVVFPVEVSGDVRSSITVVQTPAGWKAVAFGAPAFMLEFSGARAAAASAANEPPGRYFIVRVPALNLQFLALPGPSDQEEPSFVLVRPDPRLDLPVGQPVPARALIEQLVPRVRALQTDGPG